MKAIERAALAARPDLADAEIEAVKKIIVAYLEGYLSDYQAAERVATSIGLLDVQIVRSVFGALKQEAER